MTVYIAPNTSQQITTGFRAFASLSPVSVTLAALDESSKSSLEAVRNWYFWLLVISTVVVLAGVILEEAEGWMPYLKTLLPLQPLTEYRLIKKLAKFGWILICVGVMGEGVFEVLVANADTAIHRFDEALLNQARREAGDAAKSAKIAHDEADVVSRQANTIDKRLDAASIRLQEIEEDTLALSPRGRLLANGTDAFIAGLEPFVGQHVTIVACGVEDGERFSLGSMLLQFLRDAKWSWGKPGNDRWAECPTVSPGTGLEIYFAGTGRAAQWLEPYPCRARSSTAIDGVELAAKILCETLNKLKISTTAYRVFQVPGALSNARNWTKSRGSPEEMVLQEPETIFLLVGPDQPHFADRRRQAHLEGHSN
jgi:hypothetical protein